ncbi:MAG TPA: hypothetical protein VIN38_06640 [Thiobacillus sp.]
MQLLELTPEEKAFLATASAVADHPLQARLGTRLAAVLSARLRVPVQVNVHRGTTMSAEDIQTQAVPVWQPGLTLATLWLTHRLGGRQVIGMASFIPRTLLSTLDEVLAETWADGDACIKPAIWTWQLEAGQIQTQLKLQLPSDSADMKRWVEGVLGHA